MMKFADIHSILSVKSQLMRSSVFGWCCCKASSKDPESAVASHEILAAIIVSNGINYTDLFFVLFHVKPGVPSEKNGSKEEPTVQLYDGRCQRMGEHVICTLNGVNSLVAAFT